MYSTWYPAPIVYILNVQLTLNSCPFFFANNRLVTNRNDPYAMILCSLARSSEILMAGASHTT